MKAGSYLLSLSLTLSALAETPSDQPTTVPNSRPPDSSVHGRILELLKQDVTKTPAKSREAPPPFLNQNVVVNDQPVAEGVLELEPIQVTKKKPVELPIRIDPITLDNFCYGDGAIFKNANDTLMISCGPEGNKGVGGIKFTLKF